MLLRERLSEELKKAMRAKDEVRLATIRQIKAVLKNREIDAKREFDDQGIMEVISTLCKQRRESISMFKEAGRDDLVAKEEQELAVLMEFMPEQLTREEIAELVKKAISESGATSVKDMGKVMKILMPSVAGRADGKVVNEIVKELL
ncbi:MAG: GatB/YqeY domain-containing protein [Desulfuromonadales bacterium]|nr:GatB/YqeY domain-containing protein [Desulfuromonadales bacterium]